MQEIGTKINVPHLRESADKKIKDYYKSEDGFFKKRIIFIRIYADLQIKPGPLVLEKALPDDST
jgi:hypothetical protein